VIISSSSLTVFLSFIITVCNRKELSLSCQYHHIDLQSNYSPAHVPYVTLLFRDNNIYFFNFIIHFFSIFRCNFPLTHRRLFENPSINPHKAIDLMTSMQLFKILCFTFHFLQKLYIFQWNCCRKVISWSSGFTYTVHLNNLKKELVISKIIVKLRNVFCFF